MIIKKIEAICLCFMGMLTSAALAAEKEAAVFEADFSKATYAPVSENSLAAWKSKGWNVKAKELPSAWSPAGSDGFVDVFTEQDGGRFLRFKGQLIGPTIPKPVSGWLLVQVTLRNGSVTVGGLKTPSFEAGPEWTSPAFVCQLNGSAGLSLYAPKEPVDVRSIKVISANGAMDAYRNSYPLIRKPMVNLVKNGGFEETRTCLPEELKKWRDEWKWNLDEGDRVILPVGFGPHPAYKGKRLLIIDDPSQSHSGNRCVEFTLMAGGGFSAKPDKLYLFSCWARGKGKLNISVNLYGGPGGGYLGNAGVTGSNVYDLSEQWKQFQTTVPLKKEGYSRIGPNPFFSAQDGAFLDDFAVFELDTRESLLEKIDKARVSLQETLDSQGNFGPQQREMLKFLSDEAEKLSVQCSAGDGTSSTESLAHRVEALSYVTAGVKSEMEFGNTQE